MTSEGRHHTPTDDELAEARELLELLGLETLIQQAITHPIVSKLEELKVTLDAINTTLAGIEANETAVAGTLTTIAANIAALRDQLAGASGGLTAAEAQAIADRLSTDAATLQSIADQASAVQTQSAP
jgi:Fic family protein